MYEVIQITQDKYHFFIYRTDGCVAVSKKKRIFDATHSPLTSDEELINALCRKIASIKYNRSRIMGNFCGMTATDVLKTLKDLEIIGSIKIKPHRKPTHGSCCTCQDCGYYHDECVCGDNEIIIAIKNLEKEKILCKKQ